MALFSGLASLSLGQRAGKALRLVGIGFISATIALGTATAPAEAQSTRVLRVHNDPGGNLPARVEMVRNLKRSGQRVEIRDGYCMSACTLYLGLRDTCVGPTARFGFHGPSTSSYGLGLTPSEFNRWSLIMADHYPEPLRGWYIQTGRNMLMGFYEISGRELIGMGVPQCA